MSIYVTQNGVDLPAAGFEGIPASLNNNFEQLKRYIRIKKLALNVIKNDLVFNHDVHRTTVCGNQLPYFIGWMRKYEPELKQWVRET